MGPDCLNHFDAAGYFIQYMILLFDFFFLFLKISAVIGWVRKPLHLEPHPQFHPAHECFIRLLFLEERRACVPCTTLPYPPGAPSTTAASGAAPAAAQQADQRPNFFFIFLKEVYQCWKKTQSGVYDTTLRKRTNFHNELSHITGAHLVWHVIPRVQIGNN